MPRRISIKSLSLSTTCSTILVHDRRRGRATFATRRDNSTHILRPVHPAPASLSTSRLWTQPSICPSPLQTRTSNSNSSVVLRRRQHSIRINNACARFAHDTTRYLTLLMARRNQIYREESRFAR